MTQATKPREFWIDNRDETMTNFFLYNVKRGVMNYNFEGAIHTIEYSAYQAEREKVRKLSEMLTEVENYLPWRTAEKIRNTLKEIEEA